MSRGSMNVGDLMVIMRLELGLGLVTSASGVQVSMNPSNTKWFQSHSSDRDK